MSTRRDVIALLGGAAATWPAAGRAQPRAMPMVGYLSALGRNERGNLPEAFRRGLSETGFVEGRNVAIEYRYAEHQHDRLPALAADLVALRVAVIAATGGPAAVLAAKASTATIPMVFTSGGDPVMAGFVTSLNRPGGNLTGVSWFGATLGGKALGLLHELVPHASTYAMMVNPKNPETAYSPSEAQAAARTLGRELIVLHAGTPGEIDAAFATMRNRRVDALLVGSDPFFTARRQQIVALAARDSIPAMYINREFVTEGGLASYGNDPLDAYRRAGVHVSRILNGATPSDLPVEQATKFELLINLTTAKALGLAVPPMLLARADEVIE